jgi:predicted MFS family arabinose efflux permease
VSAVLDAAGSYRRLLGNPVLRGLAVADVCARLPQGIADAAPLAGLCLGPSLATLFSLASSAAPDGAGTEVQSWLSSVMNGGAAAGAALAGLTASQPMLSLAVATAAAADSAVSLARVRDQEAGQRSRPARPPADQPKSPG